MWFWVPTVKITWEAIFVDCVGEYHAAKAWEEGHSTGESSSDCADTWQRCAEYFGGPEGTVQESAAGRCMVGSSVSQPVAEDAQQEQDSRAGFGRVGREAADSPAPDRTTPAAVAAHASVFGSCDHLVGDADEGGRCPQKDKPPVSGFEECGFPGSHELSKNLAEVEVPGPPKNQVEAEAQLQVIANVEIHNQFTILQDDFTADAAEEEDGYCSPTPSAQVSASTLPRRRAKTKRAKKGRSRMAQQKLLSEDRFFIGTPSVGTLSDTSSAEEDEFPGSRRLPKTWTRLMRR